MKLLQGYKKVFNDKFFKMSPASVDLQTFFCNGTVVMIVDQ